MTIDPCKHDLDPATCSLCNGRDRAERLFPDDDPIANAARANCRSCHAEIVWCRTSTGRLMAVDADPVDGGNVYANGWSHDPRPIPTVVVTSIPDKPARTYYEAHFVGCPQRDQWRRR